MPRIRGLDLNEYIFKPAEVPKIVNRKLCKAIRNQLDYSGLNEMMEINVRGIEVGRDLHWKPTRFWGIPEVR